MKVSTAVAQVLAVSMLMAIAGSATAQQSYPSKPIRFITPYPPGGSTTIVARLIGQKLAESWGQQVIVDNRPGGNTIIGTDALAKSPPDGYTIMLMSGTHVVIPLLTPTPFDAIKDFAPVATLASTEQLLVLHPSAPANTLQEFIALAKSRPGQLNYASSGSGTSAHLVTESFSNLVGIKMQHIPYKGSGPALIDLIGGQVQVYFIFSAGAIPYIKNGKLKALAVSGASRLSALPQVPTFTEAGVPGFDAKAWYGVLAPVGTPKAVIDKLSSEIAKILAMPEIKEKLAGQGQEPFVSTAEQFAALLKAESARFAKIVKAANIRIE